MRILTLSSLLCVAGSVYGDSKSGVDTGSAPLIARANALLSSGQFNEAAKIYTDAIDLSPNDYLLYYKRATAYLSSNRHPSALEDFDKVLQLTGNTFHNAWLMKAKIHTKDGRWHEARENLKLYTTTPAGKKDTSATDMLFGISEAEGAVAKATKARKSHLWTACAEAASQALKTASHSVSVRELRAECALASGDFEGAVGDFGRITHLTSPSTPSLIRLFRLAYFFLPSSDSSTALSPLKTCLHLDPDNKPCLTAHRLVKSFAKSFAKLETLLTAEDYRGVISLLTGSGKNADFAARFDEALAENTARSALLGDDAKASFPLPDPKLYSPRRKDIVRALCKSYVRIGSPRKAEPWCDTLLKMDGMAQDVDGLVGKAEAALLREEWEEAVRGFEKAFEASGKGDRDIHQRLQKAQKLLKQSRQKDYYKVLGVARDADTRTIKKAYRKAAMTAHPDKGGSEAKMAAVNEAYEILSKPELRQRFDQGDDPNDPMAQQGGHPFAGGPGGGHPFAQFFQQQGGGFPGGGSGGFQFHFQH